MGALGRAVLGAEIAADGVGHRLTPVLVEVAVPAAVKIGVKVPRQPEVIA